MISSSWTTQNGLNVWGFCGVCVFGLGLFVLLFKTEIGWVRRLAEDLVRVMARGRIG